MNKTKIEWTRGPSGEPGYSWNPIKGLCPEACWYCYARAIYKRFQLVPEPWLDIAELNMALHTKRTDKRVFVCSTFEIFSPVADTIHERGWSWRDYIFDVIDRRRDLTFIILTKRPERIDRPMPPNVWLGVSLTGEHSSEYERYAALAKAEAQVKFVSFEPLFRQFDLDELFDDMTPDWIIVGRMTGRGERRDPSFRAIEDIVDYAAGEGVPLFMKNNLKDIWARPLIQEFPK